MDNSLYKTVVLTLLTLLSSCTPSSNDSTFDSTALTEKEIDREIQLEKIELESNLQIWKSSGIKSYRYQIDVDPFNEFSDLTPLKFEVENGVNVAIVDESGIPLSQIGDPEFITYAIDFFSEFDTIDKVYSYAQYVIIYGGDYSGVFDETLGIPINMCFYNCYQRDPLVEDGHTIISLSDFESMP